MTPPNDSLLPCREALLPCPFCGSKPVYITESDPKPPHGLRAWIKCPQCRQSQVCSDWYDGDLGTMDASWQTRISHPSASQAAMVEEMEDEKPCTQDGISDLVCDAIDRCIAVVRKHTQPKGECQ